MKVKSRVIIVALICLLAVNIPYFTQTMNNIINLFIEGMLTIWLIRRGVKTKTICSNGLIILYSSLMVICTYLNFSFSMRLVNALVTGYGYVLYFLVITNLFLKGHGEKVILQMFYIFSFLSALSTLSLIISGGKGIGGVQVLPYYIIGNKFIVSYSNMLLIALFMGQRSFIKKQKRKRIFLLGLLAYSVLISHLVDCNTGIIGCVIVALMTLFISENNRFFKLISESIVFVIFFVGINVLLVGTDVILDSPFFQKLFMEFSHTNKILTGRVEMYAIAMNAISAKPVLGHGINSTVVQDLLTWGNAQNGLLKMLLDYGAVGTAGFLGVCYNAFSRKHSGHSSGVSRFAIEAFIYAMAICSTVEINLSGYFFLSLALLKGLNTPCRITEGTTTNV